MGEELRSCQRCNAPLSRYNSESRCAACSRATPGLSIPSALWEQPSVRAALLVDDIAGVLTAGRHLLGLSQTDLADLLSDDVVAFSQAKVSRIEAGAPVKDID